MLFPLLYIFIFSFSKRVWCNPEQCVIRGRQLYHSEADKLRTQDEVKTSAGVICQSFLACRQYCFGKVFPVWNFPAFYFMHAYCPNEDGNQSSFGRFRYYYVNYRTFARRQWPSCSDYDDGMLFLAECIRIFTTWQAIPFKRKFSP